MTEEEFAAAIDGLIAEAQAKGLCEETLLNVIEDIESFLREAIASRPPARSACPR